MTIIEKYRDKIRQHMIDVYREVLESHGRMQCRMYVWSDGELEDLWGVQGDTSWLEPRPLEKREIYHITTISAVGFDINDYSSDLEDEDEREREIIDWLVDEYESEIDYLLDSIITDQEREERYWSDAHPDV